jgi:hypothetical protein
MTTLSLSPGQWRVGDRIGHRNAGARRKAGLSYGLVTITAITATNRGRTRFKIEWRDGRSGETGHFFIRNQFAELTTRETGLERELRLDEERIADEMEWESVRGISAPDY